MNDQPLKAAAILKTIKDGTAKTLRALKVKFTKSDGDGQVIARFVTQLEMLGFIRPGHAGEYAVTEKWTDAERLLDIDLCSLINRDRTFGPASPLRPSPEIFVLMSFDESLKPVYEDHITVVAKRLGRSVARADDFFTPEVIMKDIWNAINQSHVVIADCTGRNPNVFYEIGLAHAIGKPVISITQDKDDVPFDLRARRFIYYSFNPRGMQRFEETLYQSLFTVFSNNEAC